MIIISNDVALLLSTCMLSNILVLHFVRIAFHLSNQCAKLRNSMNGCPCNDV